MKAFFLILTLVATIACIWIIFGNGTPTSDNPFRYYVLPIAGTYFLAAFITLLCASGNTDSNDIASIAGICAVVGLALSLVVGFPLMTANANYVPDPYAPMFFVFVWGAVLGVISGLALDKYSDELSFSYY